jgi:hypothetical protein
VGQLLLNDSLLGKYLVHIAPYPALSGLDGANQRVRGFVEVFGGMLVFGGIAAAHVTAAQAQAQVDPGIANLHAVLANVLVCSLNFNLFQMIAGLSHKPSFQDRISIEIVLIFCRYPSREFSPDGIELLK